MKERMTSRVTEIPRLGKTEEGPSNGWRNGTRANAVASCCASSDTSSAVMAAGAVCTSGRLPIAMRLTLPKPTAPTGADGGQT